jgi:hypothetical protein
MSNFQPNARYELLPGAGARHERTLEAVSSVPLLGDVLLLKQGLSGGSIPEDLPPHSFSSTTATRASVSRQCSV